MGLFSGDENGNMVLMDFYLFNEYEIIERIANVMVRAMLCRDVSARIVFLLRKIAQARWDCCEDRTTKKVTLQSGSCFARTFRECSAQGVWQKTADCRDAHAHGVLVTKVSGLEAFAPQQEVKNQSVATEPSAVMRAHPGDQDLSFQLRFSSLLAKRHAGWRLAPRPRLHWLVREELVLPSGHQPVQEEAALPLVQDPPGA